MGNNGEIDVEYYRNFEIDIHSSMMITVERISQILFKIARFSFFYLQ